jgi:hypothetical protein
MITLMLISANPLALASWGMLAELLHWVFGYICLCNVSVEREWKRYPKNKKDHNGATISQEPKEGHVGQRREQGVHDFGYSIAYDDAKGDHAAKRTVLRQNTFPEPAAWKRTTSTAPMKLLLDPICQSNAAR